MGIDVSIVVSTEMLRDGGSLGVSFQGNDSCNYMLVFPINKNAGNTIEYLSPVLLNQTTEIELNVGWQNVQTYLNQLKFMAQNKEQEKFINNMQGLVHAHT